MSETTDLKTNHSEHLAELGAAELLGAEAALLGLVGSTVALLLGVDEVEVTPRRSGFSLAKSWAS
jgi:hypothetical protein